MVRAMYGRPLDRIGKGAGRLAARNQPWWLAPGSADSMVQQGLPVGNGRLKALAGNGPAAELLTISDATLWTGGRNDTLQGDRQFPCGRDDFGSLTLPARLTVDISAHDLDSVGNYRRTLDLARGFVTASCGHGRRPRHLRIDANFGTPSAIIEMLLYSRPGLVELLPALPAVWAAPGSVSGAGVRGGFVADLRWRNGRATRLPGRHPAGRSRCYRSHQAGNSGTSSRNSDRRTGSTPIADGARWRRSKSWALCPSLWENRKTLVASRAPPSRGSVQATRSRTIQCPGPRGFLAYEVRAARTFPGTTGPELRSRRRCR